MSHHHLTSEPRCKIVGSHRKPHKAAQVGPVPADHVITASIYLSAHSACPDLTGSTEDRRELLAKHRASTHKDGVNSVVNFAAAHDLAVVSVDTSRRLVKLSGPASKIAAAFDTDLDLFEENGRKFHSHTKPLSVPASIHPLVESVLGLDTRPLAKSHIVRGKFKAHDAQSGSVSAPHLAKLYDFPTTVNGSGQTIALIELGGGFRSSDNAQAFQAMGLPVPKIVAVSVDGAINDQSGSDADGEVALDIQVAGGVAPGAQIAVYFTPNSDVGFVDAISQAAHDTVHKPSVISISWGSPENNWSQQAMASMNSAMDDAAQLGISVYVASGDNLATDGEEDGLVHVDFPASSPYAIGCGGTHIVYSGNTITHETVWNDQDSGTGGGISDIFPVPAFQAHTALPTNISSGKIGRGVPDVAGNAAPESGYQIVVDGQAQVVGGTSAVAPLWAGLTALINQKAPHPVGFLPNWLYPARAADKTLTDQPLHGNNEPSGTNLGYPAATSSAGWSACTGLGRPVGQALFDALTKPAATV